MLMDLSIRQQQPTTSSNASSDMLSCCQFALAAVLDNWPLLYTQTGLPRLALVLYAIRDHNDDERTETVLATEYLCSHQPTTDQLPLSTGRRTSWFKCWAFGTRQLKIYVREPDSLPPSLADYSVISFQTSFADNGLKIPQPTVAQCNCSAHHCCLAFS